MNVLLDTCGLLALATGTLPPGAVAAIQGAVTVKIPPVVPWELAIKVRAGKLVLPMDPLVYTHALAHRHGLALLPAGLDSALLCASADLPPLHRDPFDRILVALALRESLVIVTSDRFIPSYPGIQTVW